MVGEQAGAGRRLGTAEGHGVEGEQERPMAMGGCREVGDPWEKTGAPPKKSHGGRWVPRPPTEPKGKPAAPQRATKRWVPPPKPQGHPNPGAPQVPSPGQGDTKPDAGPPPQPSCLTKTSPRAPRPHLSSELSPDMLIAHTGCAGSTEPLNIAQPLSWKPRQGRHPSAFASCPLPACDSQCRQRSPALPASPRSPERDQCPAGTGSVPVPIPSHKR